MHLKRKTGTRLTIAIPHMDHLIVGMFIYLHLIQTIKMHKTLFEVTPRHLQRINFK